MIQACETTRHEKAYSTHRLDLALIVPTYNERGNIGELIRRLDLTLQGLEWEVIFVDDDSPDGTADLVRSFARRDSRIRVLHRVGRRGLATACVEGIMSTSAEIVAVMDADLQHDESILPIMLERLREDSLDIVIGSRNAAGGSMGEFAAHRVAISSLGRRLSQAVCSASVSDPMSGYFMLTRSFFMECVHGLRSNGFKILVDLFASSPRPVRFGEVGYTFRTRQHGESKFDLGTGLEYLFLVAGRITGVSVPTRFLLAAMIGAFSVVAHFVALVLLLHISQQSFTVSQTVATYLAITAAFALRHSAIGRDPEARGRWPFSALPIFWAVCSVGVWANVVLARTLLLSGAHWYVAGFAGMAVSMVWNDTVHRFAPWPARRNAPAGLPLLEAEALEDVYE